MEKSLKMSLPLLPMCGPDLAGPSSCSLTHVGLLWALVVTKGAGDQGPPSPAGEDLEPSPGDAAKPMPFAFVGRKLSNP